MVRKYTLYTLNVFWTTVALLRVKLSSVLAKQQSPHSGHAAIEIEATTLTRA